MDALVWDDLDYMIEEMKNKPYDWEFKEDFSKYDISYTINPKGTERMYREIGLCSECREAIRRHYKANI